jgi:hypothetical protein
MPVEGAVKLPLLFQSQGRMDHEVRHGAER